MTLNENVEPVMTSPAVDTPTEDVSPRSEPPDYNQVVLVQVVSDSVDTRWTVNRYKVSAEALNIVPYQPGRKRIILRNLGPNTVYVGTGYDVGTVYGFPIPSGTSEEWTHEAEMWGICAAGESADVGVSIDYDVR